MTADKQKIKRTGRAGRVLAWTAALLLVPLLTGVIFSWAGLQAAVDLKLHEYIGLSGRVIDAQMEQLDREAESLGEKYSLNPALIRAELSREKVTELNRKVIAWWTEMAETGVPEEMPLWDGESLRTLLLEDQQFQEAHGALARDASGKVVSELNILLGRLMFPLRDQLVREGLEVVRRRIALTEILDLLQGIPLAETLLCVAMLGLIALAAARTPRLFRRYAGAALGGAGILSAFVLILIRLMDFSGMIRESSPRFAEQTVRLENLLTVEIGAAALVMLICAWLCLRNGKRREKTGGEPA